MASASPRPRRSYWRRRRPTLHLATSCRSDPISLATLRSSVRSGLSIPRSLAVTPLALAASCRCYPAAHQIESRALAASFAVADRLTQRSSDRATRTFAVERESAFQAVTLRQIASHLVNCTADQLYIPGELSYGLVELRPPSVSTGHHYQYTPPAFQTCGFSPLHHTYDISEKPSVSSLTWRPRICPRRSDYYRARLLAGSPSASNQGHVQPTRRKRDDKPDDDVNATSTRTEPVSAATGSCSEAHSSSCALSLDSSIGRFRRIVAVEPSHCAATVRCRRGLRGRRVAARCRERSVSGCAVALKPEPSDADCLRSSRARMRLREGSHVRTESGSRVCTPAVERGVLLHRARRRSVPGLNSSCVLPRCIPKRQFERGGGV
mmetsp:Transcript_29795/g.73214  ORF Transcript_29795/g.73214 Transcript_29795/m.73214 type:complete len:380 (+) Transcript_29795:808-1947(+)